MGKTNRSAILIEGTLFLKTVSQNNFQEADAMQKQDDERFFKDVNDKTQWERVVDSEPAKDPDVHQIANDGIAFFH